VNTREALEVMDTDVRDRDEAGQGLADPVFVLCQARTGSTLLRFLLDAHPDLACPPGTNLSQLCAQLATVWSLIEGAPLSPNRGDEPPVIPEGAIRGTRETMDRMLGSYLGRRGKKVYCDKSLGTARLAELIVRVYPGVRFLCLYRHPMDMIASGLEACPWGMGGYGFDPYIAATPGNAVQALARYWADHTAGVLAAEERFPERCLRVRYEDLVTDPEATAAGIFDFLKVDRVPEVKSACFSADRERFGPADYKIWYTSTITPDSVGRGWSLPVGLIGHPVIASVNELAGKLGYLQVDAYWGTGEPPGDLCVAAEPQDGCTDAGAILGQPAETGTAGKQARPAHSLSLGRQLALGVEQSAVRVTDWAGHAAETFTVIAVPGDPHQPAERWLVDLAARSVAFISEESEDSDWDAVGTTETWDRITSRRVNFSVALRTCQIRYCDGDHPGPDAADARIRILAGLLGHGSW
jgi:hypothetical protein